MKQHKRSKKQNKRVKAASTTRLAPVVEEEVTATLSLSDEQLTSPFPLSSSSTLSNIDTHLTTSTMSEVRSVEGTSSVSAQPSRPPLQNIAPNQNHRTTVSNAHATSSVIQKRSVLSPVNTKNTAPPTVAETATPPEDPPADKVITTTQPTLEIVLGKVVEIVTEAERNQTDLEIERLQQLVDFLNSSKSSDTTEWSLTHTELQQMVLRVVLLAKESVRRGTPPPTGMMVWQQPDKTTVNLAWAPPHHVQITTDGVVLGERLCI
ncbi:hypothetical protein FisN_18Lh172 [Fistulifera solaris]|uniref:Uncharacterized protein n=1 Tax=Fistulifera solaris TaxID=1519565 RepID=A0A1Z5JUI5_FISSO|nr:hypothetical protein FisN_18Lh172 [Fistulifera solaris]|eukprot:GAX17526.1 hypothetical protein FisN_18Lh172 [Fistulifera solaris]